MIDENGIKQSSKYSIGECGNYMDNIGDEARESLMEMLKHRK